MYQRILTIREFLGINNVEPPERVPPVDGKPAWLKTGTNIDIDDSRKPTTRGGYGDPVYSGSGIRNGFTFNSTLLFVERSDLKMLNPDYTATAIRENVGTEPMHYVGVQDRIYFTNGVIIEYYGIQDKQVHQFVDPNQTYKSVMKPGHLIEWYNGRLYVAVGGTVWASDPAAPHQTDTRRNFRSVGGYITLLRAVRDGLFVSNGRETYFWSGADFNEMQSIRVDEHPAIPGTSVLVDGEFVAKGFPSRVIVWASTHGIFAGAEGGKVFNVTKNFYRPELNYPGAAMWRKIVKGSDQQFYQYLVAQKLSSDITIDASLTPFTSTSSLTGTIS